MGLIDYQERAKVEKILLNMTNHKATGKLKEMHECFDLMVNYITDRSGVNSHNIYEDGVYEDLLTPYLKSDHVIDTLNLNPEIVFNAQILSAF